MKFSSPIRFSKKGIDLRYRNYIAFIAWAWFVPMNGVKAVFQNADTPVSQPYRNSAKLQGFEIEELLAQWIGLKHPKEHIIVLTDINVQAKNIQFWARVPKTDMQFFLKDIVVLHCKDKTEVLRLLENIPAKFAEAYGFSAGLPIAHNKED